MSGTGQITWNILDQDGSPILDQAGNPTTDSAPCSTDGVIHAAMCGRALSSSDCDAVTESTYSVDELAHDVSVKVTCVPGYIGSSNVTCNDGALENLPSCTARKPDADFADASLRQAAWTDLKAKLKSSLGGEIPTKTSGLSDEARKNERQAAKTSRRSFMKERGAVSWKDYVIEDDTDYAGYTDKVLAKRAKGKLKPVRNIKYRLAPADLAADDGCLTTAADLELEVGGIESIDLEDGACVSVKVTNKDIVKIVDTGSGFDLECSKAGVDAAPGLQAGDTFSCGGEWDIGSLTIDTTGGCVANASPSEDGCECDSGFSEVDTDDNGEVDACCEDADDDGVCDVDDDCYDMSACNHATSNEACTYAAAGENCDGTCQNGNTKAEGKDCYGNCLTGTDLGCGCGNTCFNTDCANLADTSGCATEMRFSRGFYYSQWFPRSGRQDYLWDCQIYGVNDHMEKGLEVIIQDHFFPNGAPTLALCQEFCTTRTMSDYNLPDVNRDAFIFPTWRPNYGYSYEGRDCACIVKNTTVYDAWYTASYQGNQPSDTVPGDSDCYQARVGSRSAPYDVSNYYVNQLTPIGTVTAACAHIRSDLCNSLDECERVDYECVDEVKGCTTPTACNYDILANKDDDSCTYAVADEDCDGNCLAGLVEDCNGVCGGTAEDLGCGCGNPAAVENYNCAGDCIVAIDCALTCGGNAEVDTCGECDGSGPKQYKDCDGNCLTDADGDGVCDEVDPLIDSDNDGLGDNADTVSGCKTSTACNYDSSSTVNEDSTLCDFADAAKCETCVDGASKVTFDADEDGVCDDVDTCIGGDCVEDKVVVEYDGQRYEACEGATVQVLKNGNHNIWEDEEAVIEPLSTNAVTTTLLGAPKGTTRTFYCSAHPEKTFEISCCDSSKDNPSTYINNQCCQCS